jgi:hypothetical protein
MQAPASLKRHPLAFNVGGLTIGTPEFDEDGFSSQRTFEASEIRLQDLSFPYDEDPKLTILYQYDFGDNWRHLLILKRIPRQIGVNYPRCLGGSRSAPPEDVGSCHGYAQFVEAWADPDHEEHKDMHRWIGRKFDPERFDLEATNKAIAQALRAARGGYRFRRFR